MQKLHDFLDNAKVGEKIAFKETEINYFSLKTVVTGWKRHNRGADKTFFTRAHIPEGHRVKVITVYCEEK